MPAAANAAVATGLARTMTPPGTPARPYVKTVTSARAWGMRVSARPSIAAATMQVLLISFASIR